MFFFLSDISNEIYIDVHRLKKEKTSVFIFDLRCLLTNQRIEILAMR